MSKVVDAEDFLDLCNVEGNEEAVRQALETQPELVNSRDTRLRREGWTPLHVASMGGHEEVVRLLLEHGADVHAQKKDGDAALHLATVHRRDKVMRVLLEHGAHVNAHGKHNSTPLHRAARGCLARAAKLLLEHGADVNARGHNGGTPLHCASIHGFDGLARMLLEHGADRSIVNNDGETACHRATRRSKHKTVELLHTYVPATPLVVQVLLGMRGPSESALTRLAGHELFEPKVLMLVKCLLTGERSAVLEKLQGEAQG